MNTFMTDICQIRHSDRALTDFIHSNELVSGNAGTEILEDARYFRANVRDQKKIIDKKKIHEVTTMTEADIYLAGLTELEQEVCVLRLDLRTSSFKEIDKALNYKTEGSSSHKIYKRAIRKIEKYLMLPEDEKIKMLLSDLEYQIHIHMQQNLTNREIAEVLGKSKETIKSTKTRLRRKMVKLKELSVPVEGVNI